MSARNKRARRDGTFAGINPGRAIIDIGSNTVRMVVYGGSMRAPTVLLNEKVTPQLGRNMSPEGALAQDAVALAMRGLKRFALLLEDLGVNDVETVATAAVREASNGAEFIAEIKKLGFNPRVLSGEDEACISSHGVAGAFPDAHGSVADLGGGSLELVTLDKGKPGGAVSMPLGSLRLPAFRPEGGKNPESQMRKSLEKVIRKAGWDLSDDAERKGQPLYLVGGTWRAMAVFAMLTSGNPLSDPHGFELSPKQAGKIAKTLSTATPNSLQALNRISSMRSEMLPNAAVLLQAVLAMLSPSRIIFSSWGLREGLLYDRLPLHEKAQDPLLAGISVFASQRGAPPILATRIAGWTAEAAPPRKSGSERLRLAATHLALASMQIEPNIRMPQAIDWALHKRWIAVNGKERAMLAAAIAANGNALDLPGPVRGLASEDAIEEAICWGLAVRLARRLGARSGRSLLESRLRVLDGTLVLRLAESHADLFGVPTEKDIELLSGRLGLDWKVEIVPVEELHAEAPE